MKKNKGKINKEKHCKYQDNVKLKDKGRSMNNEIQRDKGSYGRDTGKNKRDKDRNGRNQFKKQIHKDTNSKDKRMKQRGNKKQRGIFSNKNN